ncbi:hypothetical protein [Lactiplantibacillus pingfangensis]|uniref:hypothetical protein n=1 Tax=Lactiplantibacillus pingfangensis TaxID=2559915 RepID=UPI0014851BEE|nr:hypothetical protein [Lactiplantibacillus pingfangensis]
MGCKLCGGARVVQQEIMPGVVTVAPCPNCTEFKHDHYEKELEAIKHEKVSPRIAVE